MTAISDRDAIVELLHRYAFAIDDKDWPALREVFTSDCVADYKQFGRYEDIDAVIGFMEPAHADLTTQHAMANITVTFDGSDSAVVRSSVIVTLQPAGAALFRAGGRYDDVVRRSAGAWRIAERTYTTIWEEH